MCLQGSGDFRGALDRRLRIVEKDKAHPIAGRNPDQFSLSVGVAKLLGLLYQTGQLIHDSRLIGDEEQGIADHVYRENVGDLDLLLRLALAAHKLNVGVSLLRNNRNCALPGVRDGPDPECALRHCATHEAGVSPHHAARDGSTGLGSEDEVLPNETEAGLQPQISTLEGWEASSNYFEALNALRGSRIGFTLISKANQLRSSTVFSSQAKAFSWSPERRWATRYCIAGTYSPRLFFPASLQLFVRQGAHSGLKA